MRTTRVTRGTVRTTAAEADAGRGPGGLPSAALAAALLLGVAVLAGVALAACGEDEGAPAAPDGVPGITGVVARATPVAGGDVVASFLIEDGRGDYDKATVKVTDDTAWYRRSGDGYEAVARPTAAALISTTVEVQFTGAVAESYPVQATAGWVVLAD